MKATYTFLCETESRGQETKVSVSTNAITLDELLNQFSDFLKGCGFSFHSIEANLTDPEEFTAKPKL